MEPQQRNAYLAAALAGVVCVRVHGMPLHALIIPVHVHTRACVLVSTYTRACTRTLVHYHASA
eukprot:13361562-Alexandrium_andersonii.AAC.1